MEFIEKSMISWPVMDKLIEELQRLDVKSVELTGGGEPTIYPHFDQIIKRLGATDLELALVTNGTGLTPERMRSINPDTVRWIRFSMDSVTPETHKEVHKTPNAQFNQIRKHFKYAVSMKDNYHRNFRLGVSFVIVPENIHEIDAAARYWKEMGADNIRYSFTYDKNQDGRLNTDMRREVFTRLDTAKDEEDSSFRVFGWKSRLDDYATDNTGFDFCHYQYGTVAIGSDGGVWPCCITKYYPEHSIGNINNQTLHNILLGKQREMSFNVKKCPPCWMKNKIIFVDQIIKGEVEENMTAKQQEAFQEYKELAEPPHVNFP